MIATSATMSISNPESERDEDPFFAHGRIWDLKWPTIHFIHPKWQRCVNPWSKLESTFFSSGMANLWKEYPYHRNNDITKTNQNRKRIQFSVQVRLRSTSR